MSEIYPQPVAGQDYPQTWSQFLDWFHSEEACLDYLERLRWPKNFICQRCGVIGAASKTSRHRLVCQSCKHQTSVTAGTIFDKTRTPLKVWLAAAWYITNQKHGVSALGLQRVLGLGSYQTAWAMPHRFRRAMVRPGRDLLTGLVEVDETYVAIGFKKKEAPAKPAINAIADAGRAEKRLSFKVLGTDGAGKYIMKIIAAKRGTKNKGNKCIIGLQVQ